MLMTLQEKRERAPTHSLLKGSAPRWRPAPVILTMVSLCHNPHVGLVQRFGQPALPKELLKNEHTDWRCRGK